MYRSPRSWLIGNVLIGNVHHFMGRGFSSGAFPRGGVSYFDLPQRGRHPVILINEQALHEDRTVAVNRIAAVMISYVVPPTAEPKSN